MSTEEDPKIKFAGKWIPAHEAWEKMELSSSVKDVIKQFNRKFPDLSTEASRRVVPVVEERLKNFEMQLPPRSAIPPELAGIAQKLLLENAPEDVLDILIRDHDFETDMLGLINLAGEAAYLGALASEANVLEANKIHPGQAASLWNELSRPAPGGGLWSEKTVRKLIDDLQG